MIKFYKTKHIFFYVFIVAIGWLLVHEVVVAKKYSSSVSYADLVEDIYVSNNLNSIYAVAAKADGSENLQYRLYISRDNGRHWLIPKELQNEDVTVISASKDEQKLYVGAKSGKLFISTDSGKSWQNVHTFNGGEITLISNAKNGATVFVAQQDSTSASLYQSVDGGKIFNEFKSDVLPSDLTSIVANEDGSQIYVTSRYDGVYIFRNFGQQYEHYGKSNFYCNGFPVKQENNVGDFYSYRIAISPAEDKVVALVDNILFGVDSDMLDKDVCWSKFNLSLQEGYGAQNFGNHALYYVNNGGQYIYLLYKAEDGGLFVGKNNNDQWNWQKSVPKDLPNFCSPHVLSIKKSGSTNIVYVATDCGIYVNKTNGVGYWHNIEVKS